MTPKWLSLIMVLAVLIYDKKVFADQIFDTIDPKLTTMAPALNVIRWVKGEPIDSLRTGQIYLIDFGFVLCTPCRNAIPHLSGIAQKYGDQITVIGIQVLENTDKFSPDTTYVNRVTQFVTRMGNRIRYSVAVDVPSQETHENWMKKFAPQSGYPTCFIVNQNKEIVWHGKPNDADKIIQLLLACKFEKRNSNYINQVDSIALSIETIYNLIDSNKLQIALETTNNLFGSNPEREPLFLSLKYKVLAQIDSLEARKWLKYILNKNPGNYDWFHFASQLLHEKNTDPKLIEKVAQNAFLQARSESDNIAALSLHFKANAFFKQKLFKKALKTEILALKLLKRSEEDVINNLQIIEDQLDYWRHVLVRNW